MADNLVMWLAPHRPVSGTGPVCPATGDAYFTRRFNGGGNIGVLLGEASAGLCTVDLDGEKEASTFLGINPGLRDTLQTARVRGRNFWVRIVGDFPAAGKLKDRATGQDLGEWRADGNQTVIHGAAMDATKGETQPTAYRIVCDAPPLEIAFEEIRWPDGWLLPWVQEEDPAAVAERQLIEEHSEPFTESEKGKAHAQQHVFCRAVRAGGGRAL